MKKFRAVQHDALRSAEKHSANAECESSHLNLSLRKVAPTVMFAPTFSKRLFKAQRQNNRSANAERYPSLCKVNVPRTVTLATITFVLTALFLVSCNKYTPEDTPILGTVPTADYTLEESDCSWNFANIKADSVHIINSETELMKFITGNAPPNIDFTQQSLILVCGNTNGSTSIIDKNFERLSSVRYKLDIEMYLNSVDTPQQWYVAITVPKMATDVVVELNALYRPCEDTIFVTDIDYKDFVWKNFAPDSLYIINSEDELSAALFSDTLPSIDFSNHTILCAWGVGIGAQVVSKKIVFLKNYCINQYVLDVTIYCSPNTVPPPYWFCSVITPKIHNNAEITFNLKKQ